ncbi:MAG: hypothetical protein B6I26_08590 [Desulfobacteraceae bacterium 4572_130]|nr:MAG: hypothetical protein B6I26_08590 [Desulfobacteraceae bacterium 4572_130]
MKKLSENHIRELQNTIITAQLNYEICWALREKNNRKRYVDTMNEYPNFFCTSIHAHFVATVMALYKLYEKRKDTINLPKLVRTIKAESSIPPHDIATFEKEIEELKPLWVKISILRNNLFGHYSDSIENEMIWEKADLAYNQIKELIEGSKIIFNSIYSKWKKTQHAFNLSATADITNLLEDLGKFNNRL